MSQQHNIPNEALIEIKSPEEIPEFANEEEMHTYWSKHSIGEEFMKNGGSIPREEGPAARIRQRFVAMHREP
ncbi:MAG: hypothetical protein ACR2PL_01970 [Dehalococcoidia bacterium]